ncbi:sulfite oxidase heme-binding subunit YedZ [Methylomonas sp. BW4-1]|uniref:sulfite oxidase heme-binding subunit YedZ n=1 Tax=Methylomonas sp. BW4-1 TaxID=3376685 RepID=UPI0040425283
MNWKALDDTHLRRLKLLVFLAALLPLGLLLTAAWQDQLGANPIEKITHKTGYWTLTFLLISLGVTPLRQLSGANWLVRLRRMLGLFAFFYACLHFSTYLVLDQFFDWPAIAKDILKRPYITVGFAAFVLLIPLAVTSTNAMQRRLGGKNWKRLHGLVYPIAAAGVVHFAWLVKKDLSRPLLFGGILVLLLVLRWFYKIKSVRLRRSYSSI